MKVRIEHLVSDLNDALEGTSLFSGNRVYISGLIYEIEAELAKIKKEVELKSYNPHIYSKRIADSFATADHSISGDFGKPVAYTQTDYQYYLLIYLLRNYHELISRGLTLHQKIDKFIDLHKENSLTYHDVQLTATGASR